MKSSELENFLLKLGPSFKPSSGSAQTSDCICLEVDDVDFTVVADNSGIDRVTVCCLFGPIPADKMTCVLRGIVMQNLELMRKRSHAAFGVLDGDLIYTFSTDVNSRPEVLQALGGVMRSAASSALEWQQSL